MTDHPHSDATSETAPWPVWHAAVLEIARVSTADAARYVGARRLHVSYQAGEPTWLVAAELRILVDLASRMRGDPGSGFTRVRCATRAHR